MDFIILAVIGIIIGLAVAYIVKAKKSGKKCIGCPDGGSCGCGCSNCKNHTTGCGSCSTKDAQNNSPEN